LKQVVQRSSGRLAEQGGGDKRAGLVWSGSVHARVLRYLSLMRSRLQPRAPLSGARATTAPAGARLLPASLLALALSLCLLPGVQADSRGDFLIRMLSTSSQFRVRAQAALALGSGAPDESAVNALAYALRKDDHPAVRAASASALERLRATNQLSSLKEALRDEDKAVRAAAKRAIEELSRVAAIKQQPSSLPSSGPSMFYVGVGTPATQAQGLSPNLLRVLRDHVAREVMQFSGVRLAPEKETPAAAERELKTQKLTGYYIDSSVTSLETRPDGSIRAQVSVIVGTYPGRDMRAMLSGAATISGVGTGDSARLEAVQAAYSGALRRLPQAMQAGLARAP
jgi:HEAT repeats